MEEHKFGRELWESPYRKIVDTHIAISRLHRCVLERQLNRGGVYRSQHQFLMYIVDNPNASQKEIAEKFRVSTATVAVSLKKLEQGGYIRRGVDQKDNRFNQICATEKGMCVAEKSRRYFQKVECGMFNGFTAEDTARLQGYLDRMYQNLKDILSEAERREQN